MAPSPEPGWLTDTVRRACERQLASPYTRPGHRELAHKLLYPEAVDHGAHATGKVVDTHSIVLGREYVGRHRPRGEGAGLPVT